MFEVRFARRSLIPALLGVLGWTLWCAPSAPQCGPVPFTPSEVCGDGVVDAGEECDDGDGDDTDGCNTYCERCAMAGLPAGTYGGVHGQCCAGLVLVGGLCNLP